MKKIYGVAGEPDKLNNFVLNNIFKFYLIYLMY